MTETCLNNSIKLIRFLSFQGFEHFKGFVIFGLFYSLIDSNYYQIEDCWMEPEPNLNLQYLLVLDFEATCIQDKRIEPCP